MSNVFIRPLKADEREAWQPLWKGYQDYYQTNLDDTTDSLWQRLMEDDPAGPFCLVAESDGKLLGLVQYLFHGTTWSAHRRIYIHDLYTVQEARGQGIGRKLIEAVYAVGKQSNCDQVYWLTQDFNEDGRRLYDKVSTLTPFIKYMQKL
jgi:GNAT superfamily N-acetyltransferase